MTVAWILEFWYNRGKRGVDDHDQDQTFNHYENARM